MITEKTVAIVPVHVYGNVCNVYEIERIAKKHDLKVVYDASHAFGEEYDGKGIASFGDISTFSFHATKVFHTIEGGAVSCNVDYVYDCLYDLKNFGIRNEEIIAQIGANAKMNEFSAIMGICNLNYVDEWINDRKIIVEKYIEQLREEKNIVIPYFEEKNIKRNYAYFPVKFETRNIRDKVYDYLKKNGVFSRKYFYPLTCDADCYKGLFHLEDVHVANEVSDTILVLPLYTDLDECKVEYICNLIICELDRIYK